MELKNSLEIQLHAAGRQEAIAGYEERSDDYQGRDAKIYLTGYYDGMISVLLRMRRELARSGDLTQARVVH